MGKVVNSPLAVRKLRIGVMLPSKISDEEEPHLVLLDQATDCQLPLWVNVVDLLERKCFLCIALLFLIADLFHDSHAIELLLDAASKYAKTISRLGYL